jgi:outer membrane protein TolC
LTLEAAMREAQTQSPRVAAQRASLDASGAAAGRAAALPDPKLAFGIDNLPVSGADAWNYKADSMTMRRIGVMQEFPNGEKRRLRQERAEGERAVDAAMLASTRLELARESGLAWFEAYHAAQVLAVLDETLAAARLDEATLAARLKGGRASAAEGLTVQGAVHSAEDRVQQQQRVLARAKVMLARYLGGEAAQRPLASPPDTARLPLGAEQLIARHREYAPMQVYAQRERLAETDVRLADAGRRPDWSAELLYGQREPYYSNMITLMFRVDLPIFQGGRQDLDVSSRAAASRAAALQAEDARRAYEAQIRGDLIDWQTAQSRAARYEQSLLPLAEQRLAASAAAYRGGRGELKEVIEAQRMLAETRVGWHDALLERGRAWLALVTLVEGVQP